MYTDTTRTTNQPTYLGEVTTLPELPTDFLAEAKAEGA